MPDSVTRGATAVVGAAPNISATNTVSGNTSYGRGLPSLNFLHLPSYLQQLAIIFSNYQ
jgi:hypothetical protein